ncbi:MAG: SdpI family protein [Ruminococcus bromii]|nr:SdpI family protein [Ruminococcus bromii]
MKSKYYVISALMFLTLIYTIIFMIISPDSIPMHYNVLGEIDRYGSKYEMIMLPIFVLISSIVPMLFAKHFKSKSDKSSEKLSLNVGIVLVLMFIALYVLFSVMALNSNIEYGTDIGKVIIIAIGIFFTVLCNLMPKARLNSLFGIRTSWSIANEKTWQKSQRFGGYSGVICGIILVISGLVFSFEIGIIVTIVLITLWAVLSSIMSYVFYKKYD